MSTAPAGSPSILNTRRRMINTFKLPEFQFRLPVVIMVMSVLFASLCAGLGHHTYTSLLEIEPPTTADSSFYANLIDDQMSSALGAMAVLALLYSMAVMAVWLWHSRRVMGPEVAFRRHIEALKNGDYSARVALRPGDAFMGLANDLNELAEVLASDEKAGDPTGGGAPQG